MSSTASPSRYGATAIALHWLLAVGIVGAFGVGVYMTGLPFSLGDEPLITGAAAGTSADMSINMDARSSRPPASTASPSP